MLCIGAAPRALISAILISADSAIHVNKAQFHCPGDPTHYTDVSKGMRKMPSQQDQALAPRWTGRKRLAEVELSTALVYIQDKGQSCHRRCRGDAALCFQTQDNPAPKCSVSGELHRALTHSIAAPALCKLVRAFVGCRHMPWPLLLPRKAHDLLLQPFLLLVPNFATSWKSVCHPSLAGWGFHTSA